MRLPSSSMQRLQCAIFTIFALFAIPSLPNASGDVTYDAAAPPGPIVISELMWSGSSGSSADEWIELYNRSAATIDLSGWTLTRLTTANLRSSLSLTLPLSRRARPSLLPTALSTSKNFAWPLNPNSSLYRFHCPIANCFCNYMTILQQTEGHSSTQLMMVEELLLLARLLPNRPWFALPSTNPVTNRQAGQQQQCKVAGTPMRLRSELQVRFRPTSS